jgi:hypothetical protein
MIRRSLATLLLMAPLLMSLWTLPARADGPPLFTDVAPEGGGTRHKGRHDHGGYVEEGEDGRRYKRLWLKDGLGPKADYAHAPPPSLIGVFQIDPLGRVSELPKDVLGHEGLKFPLTDEGFYATYAIEKTVRDGRLWLSVAKSEVLMHSCRDGRHDRLAVAERIPHHTLAQAPIEVVRERLDGEDFHTELRSGDELAFRVLKDGQPAAGATVRMVTGHGWEKTVVSDAEGRARFQMIRDYYPAWDAFERRHRERFLVLASLELDQEGSLDGQPYQRARFETSLPGSYLPSKSDYLSSLVGLAIGLFALTFTGLAVYLYRRRRLRPFQEIPVHG